MNVSALRFAVFLPVCVLTFVPSYGELPTVRVNSIEALQDSAGLTEKRIVLAPYRYDLNRRDGTPVFLDLLGNDCEYDLTGARLRVDSQSHGLLTRRARIASVAPVDSRRASHPRPR